MFSVEREVTINVPVGFAYHYLSDAAHISEFFPDITNITIRFQGHSTYFTWRYYKPGAYLAGEAHLKPIRVHRQIDVRYWGGLSGYLSWHFLAHQHQTRLVLDARFSLPTALLRRQPEADLMQHSEHEVDVVLLHLRQRIEAAQK